MHLAQTTFGIAECAPQKSANLIFGQRLEHIDAAA